MMRLGYFLLFLLFASTALSQEIRIKKVAPTRTFLLDSVSINPFNFEMRTSKGAIIDTSFYTVDYASSIVTIKPEKFLPKDTITITYRVYPDFLTKTYRAFDPKVIVKSTGLLDKVVQLNSVDKRPPITPFSGLNVSGSILRGVTSGSNQNSTLKSELDLQISGKLSERVTLRASIQDANIPNQQGGYSQNLDEFDQVFIELASDKWNVKAGDINLQNDTSYFSQFTKKIQGLSLGGVIDHSENKRIELFASGALVRGVFSQSTFTGQEGNQGPYKLTGPNGELFVLIVSGSESVFVNGSPLKRGESEDYVIDYNAGELRFNPTYPITSDMRITVEYQFSERSYTRFLAYGGGSFTTNDKLKISAQVYTESDAKNQPLQQQLSTEQVDILQNAGDAIDAMVAPSAIPDTYDENKILYRRFFLNGREVYEFSTSQEEQLYLVRFSNVGENQGDYILNTTNTLQRTFQYVAPIAGVPQGSFAPQVQLFAPTVLQIATVNGRYTPSKATTIDFEGAASKNDLNTFSKIDDLNNNGFGTHLDVMHRLLTKDSINTLKLFGKWDYVQENFVNIEGLYNVEFNRDWNLENSLANANGSLLSSQNFTTLGVEYAHRDYGNIVYQFQNLNFISNYDGIRHGLQANLKNGNLKTTLFSSFLKTDATILKTSFGRARASTTYHLKNKWIGSHYEYERNKRVTKLRDSILPDSHKFNEYGAFVGIGDSTKVFTEIGFRFRESDSVRVNNIQPTTSSKTYYLNSQLLKNKYTKLSLYTNYRTLNYKDDRDAENSLNARLLYDQQLANGFIRANTLYETNSGTQPQQEFTYVEVDEGLGQYTWNDYNNDQIQQLEEFETAQFQDQARFVRILLPNQIFVRTHQNRISQQLTINPSQWNSKSDFRKYLSKFYNQTSYTLDRKILRNNDTFSLNPFNESDSEIGALKSFRNTFFFNRGKQQYASSYTLLATKNKSLLSTGLQENTTNTQQYTLLHTVHKNWLINFKSEWSTITSNSQNFNQRNFRIKSFSWNPAVSYLLTKQSRVSIFFERAQKENEIQEKESLKQNNLGLSFAFSNLDKFSFNGELRYIDNTFSGSPFSPVAYQMLEGLQPNKNLTWNLLAQKRVTKFLDLNVSYFGRASATSKTIHTGNLQLKAFF